MQYSDNQPRSSKPIFDTSLNYTRSPGTVGGTKGQAQLQMGISANQREGSVLGGGSIGPSKQWQNPMFDPNASQMSTKKVKLFDEDKQEESMRTTHINIKTFGDPQKSVSLTPKDTGNVPAPMRPTINSVMKLSARQSNIPKERTDIRSPKDNRPLQPYFKDKRILVTGASSGIGRATALW